MSPINRGNSSLDAQSNHLLRRQSQAGRHQKPYQKELEELAAAGVPLIACRTCLDYYGLLDQVVVGEIGNMLRIVEAQATAAKVITL